MSDTLAWPWSALPSYRADYRMRNPVPDPASVPAELAARRWPASAGAGVSGEMGFISAFLKGFPSSCGEAPLRSSRRSKALAWLCFCVVHLGSAGRATPQALGPVLPPQTVSRQRAAPARQPEIQKNANGQKGKQQDHRKPSCKKPRHKGRGFRQISQLKPRVRPSSS